jgi:hypothetical protein
VDEGAGGATLVEWVRGSVVREGGRGDAVEELSAAYAEEGKTRRAKQTEPRRYFTWRWQSM